MPLTKGILISERTMKLPNRRIAKWDNIKGLLIILVVFGHLLLPVMGKSDLLKAAFVWLNTFHMPLFIFISGLFSKNTVNAPRLSRSKITSYLMIFFFMKITVFLSTHLSRGYAYFRLISEDGTPWYIFVSAVFLTLTFLIKNLNPKKVLAISLCLSVLAGYLPDVESTLCLSRTVVFFPVFYLGYITDIQKLLDFSNKLPIKIVSLLIFLSFTVCFIFIGDEHYFMRFVFTGNSPYKNLPHALVAFGPLLRLGFYALSSAVGFSLISLMPARRIPLLTRIGANTLPVYALHRQLLYFFQFSALPVLLGTLSGSMNFVILLVAAVVLSLLLSSKPFAYVLYPCTHYQKWTEPILRWLKK